MCARRGVQLSDVELVFFFVLFEAAVFVALAPAVGHFFVPVGAGDLGVGRGREWGDGCGVR
jgi:hypothetical protein